VNYKYMIVYKKQDGNIIYRACRTKPKYNKGESTSMGWYVLDILHLYNGKALSYIDYDALLQRRLKIRNITKYIDISLIEKVFYLILLMIILHQLM